MNPLQPLNTNVFDCANREQTPLIKKQDAHTKQVTKESILNVLEHLQLREATVLQNLESAGTISPKRVCFLINGWKLKEYISQYYWFYKLMYRIERTGYMEYEVTCLHTDLLLGLITECGFLTLKLQNPVRESDFATRSTSYISTDGYSLVLLNNARRVLIDDFRKHMHMILWCGKNGHYKRPNTITTTPPNIVIPPITVKCGIDRSDRLMPLEYRRLVSSIETVELQLTKPSVTYLIGPQGQRIEEIRAASGATIKVCPLAHRLSNAQLSQSTHNKQQVSITGTHFNVTKAVTMIELELLASSRPV
ncbi:Mer1p KNAG_0F01020 [Huiozyma naganishii CBS 8797]|uniref:K Homology domain-containing protein n=1 Tax=Huiozyma naganishii (strain ATCC MYA-139 / BCRC 22969 / CBS 8797 / KCTC 17520 / NBRC 10181 / NCYC 3082 / Yp74L-3) TaxID=1071383 RepID=J7S888_HUIN7|nr:hypothetical protein KNAG_0F01020 [Kazachstania naganishii CBS 8797]CCK70771.1 hypothetical protein KNAG_0F01020 [Kazachstania naganishii CBS 8797]